MESVVVGGVELAIDRRGSGSPVLYLHGDNGLRNAGLLNRLAEHHEIVAPVHPGFPGSPVSLLVDTVADIAFVYAELVEQLGEPLTLVGASFGGWIAAQLAVTHPAMFAAVVLVSPLGIKTRDRETRDFVDIYLTPHAERPSLFYGDDAIAATVAAVSDEDFLHDAICEDAIARYCWKPYMYDPKLLARLRRIAAPTLVISGAADRFPLDPSYYATFAAAIGDNAHRVTLEGGHRLDETSPSDVAAAIEQHVASVLGLATTRKGV